MPQVSPRLLRLLAGGVRKLSEGCRVEVLVLGSLL